MTAWLVAGLLSFVLLSHVWERLRPQRKKEWWKR